MIKLDLTSEYHGVLAFQDNRLVGQLGIEFDVKSGRGWLRGPFVLRDGKDWNQIASKLLADLLPLVPTEIHRMDSFLNVANERGNEFYLNHGHRRIGLVHLYLAPAPEAKLEVISFCGPIEPGQEPSFASLHDSLFPQTYISGHQILAEDDTDKQLFVYAHENEIWGYVYATIEEGLFEGEVNFLGVRADARGRGIGRQLLLTALQWLFETKSVPAVRLVVSDELAAARSLYESVGFSLKYTGVHTRIDRKAK